MRHRVGRVSLRVSDRLQSDWRSVCEFSVFNPLNVELNPICHLLALLGAHHILHVSKIRVKRSLYEVTLKIQNSTPIVFNFSMCFFFKPLIIFRLHFVRTVFIKNYEINFIFVRIYPLKPKRHTRFNQNQISFLRMTQFKGTSKC
jgi:hypothetical protein